MASAPQGVRPRLTPAVLAWGLVDALGMGLFADGLSYVIHGHALFSRVFPTSLGEGVAETGLGLFLMVYGAIRVLRTTLGQMNRPK